jgi:hypothetical protein
LHYPLRRRVREPELHQALKLYELLPQEPNDLWQMDVTYLHIPGYRYRKLLHGVTGQDFNVGKTAAPTNVVTEEDSHNIDLNNST